MYERIAILQGPQDAILSVTFSADGKFVAALGYSGVVIWDLSTSAPVTVPQVPYNPRQSKYVFTASSWLTFESNNRPVLLLGSLRGDLLAWGWDTENKAFEHLPQIPPQTKDNGILSIDVYQPHVAAGRRGRVAVGAADRSIRVFSLSVFGEWDTVFSVTLEEGFLPTTVRFRQGTQGIFAFSRTGGNVMQLDRRTGEILSHKKYGPDIMASVCLHQSNNCFVACTGRDFQMFKLSSLELVFTFEGENPVVRYPKHATFAEGGQILVGGTDRGCAIVYEARSGNAVQTLEYPRGGLVQHVAALMLDDRHLIAIAGSTLQQPANVIVFQKQRVEQVPPATNSINLNNDADPALEDLDTNVTSHADSVSVSFRVRRVSPWIIFRNLLFFALILHGMYTLAQEHMHRLVQFGREAGRNTDQEVGRAVVVPDERQRHAVIISK